MTKWTIAAGLAGWGALFLGIDALLGILFLVRPCGPHPEPETCASAIGEWTFFAAPLILIGPFVLAPPRMRARLAAVGVSCLTLVVGPLLIAVAIVLAAP